MDRVEGLEDSRIALEDLFTVLPHKTACARIQTGLISVILQITVIGDV